MIAKHYNEGDWVAIKMLPEGKFLYGTIQNFDYEIAYISADDGLIHGVMEERIFPVEIKPETLKANGFKAQNVFGTLWEKRFKGENCRIRVNFLPKDRVEITVAENQTNYYYIVIKSKYVHSLQHALRLAELDSIANRIIIVKP